MKNLICFLVMGVILTILSSCGDWAKMTYPKTKSVSINYVINSTGNFSEEKYINEYDLKKLFDIPEDSKIEKVVINGVSINLEKLPATDASFLDLEAKLKVKTIEGNTINYNLVEKAEYSVLPIALLDVNKLLDPNGIKAIKEFLQKVADPLSNPGSTTASVTIKGFAHSLLGEPETINIKCTVNLNATILFSTCEYMKWPIVGGDCDL